MNSPFLYRVASADHRSSFTDCAVLAMVAALATWLPAHTACYRRIRQRCYGKHDNCGRWSQPFVPLIPALASVFMIMEVGFRASLCVEFA